jgi:hypothetical protein
MALELITEQHGLAFTKLGDQIYRIHRPQVVETKEIMVELYTRSGIEGLDDQQIRMMVGGTEISPPEARSLALARTVWTPVGLRKNGGFKSAQVGKRAGAVDFSVGFNVVMRSASSRPEPSLPP